MTWHIPVLGMDPRELEVYVCTKTCAQILILCVAALFTVTKRWTQVQCSLTDVWINTVWYIRAVGHLAIKGMKYWYMLQHGVSQKRLHIV